MLRWTGLVIALQAGACGFSVPALSEKPIDARTSPDAGDPPPPTPDGCSACGRYQLVAAADSYLRAQFPNETHETTGFQRCGSGDPANCCTNRAIYRFDLDALPAGCVIASAALNTYFYAQDYTGRSPTFGVHRVLADWTESQVSWNRRTNMSWSTAGGDFDPVPVVSIVVASGAFGWLTWDVTPLAIAWTTGTANQGMIVVEPNDLAGAIQGRKFLRTREATEVAQRPFLDVTCTD